MIIFCNNRDENEIILNVIAYPESEMDFKLRIIPQNGEL